ncbi:uncharacterized protein LOC134831545 [Culicoides brevitarsis]|uniref:uncharacterized protein LOC134831545 n=1 Tax=Culicoides brevitarsis TaxID=469753 RepID=UPI00307CA7B5
MIFQATQLLLIIISLLCKVNGISFRHSAPSTPSGFVTTQSITDALFAPLPTREAPFSTIDHTLAYGLLGNSIDPLEAYISGKDGRILKQYEVFENHGEPDIYNLDTNLQQTSLSPFFYSTIANQLLDPYIFNGKGIGYGPSISNLPTIKSQLTKSHGPIALGSGALGYIRLPSGAVYLGSGSLGYISHKEHHDSLTSIHERRKIASIPGPLSFGHRHHD